MSRPSVEHQIISASAGSGKTFRLTNRYLALIADGVAPASIWATTFTRKAAGEILDRILTRLTAASASDEAALQLATALHRPAMTRANCVRVLRRLLSEIHRLRIGTIDSLFLGLAGAFSMELGLPAGWAIADEADAAAESENALDQTLTGDERRIEELIRLYARLSPVQARRSVRSDLLEKVGNLYSAFLTVPSAGWQMAIGETPTTPIEVVAMQAEGVALQDKRAIAAVAKDMRRATLGQWEEFVESGLAPKILNGDCAYYNKPIPGELVDCYRRLIALAASSIRCDAAREIAAAREFLEEFDRQVRIAREAGRGIRFDDVNRALADRLSSIQGGLAFRMDGTIGHILLDEFQDTSALQWHAIEPLTRTVMAAGGSVFAVGDPKQAIYGWRGGRVELFNRLPAFLGGVQAEEMDHSRRSAPVVIDSVNLVFLSLTDSLVDDAVRTAGTRWQSRFRRHTTEQTALRGFVQIETGPGQCDDELTDGQRVRHYAFVAERVAGIARRHPSATVGVLCRKNKSIARMVFELRIRGVAASQEGGNPITDSPAVEGILSLFSLADHPGDSVAAFHLATEPFASMLRKQGYDPSSPGPTASRVRADLIDAGYGPLVAELSATLKAVCPQSDGHRLDQLMEVADAYQHRATLRPSDFVAWVRQHRATALAPSHVRVLTLHTAKGLEYDAVVLPELDVAFADRIPSPFVVADPDPPELPNGFVGRRVTSGLRPLADAEAVKQTDLAKGRAIEESMSLLYVALTRSRQGLYLYPPGPQNRNRKDCWDNAVLRALCPDAPTGVVDRPERQTLFTDGEPDWQPPRADLAGLPTAPAGPIHFAPSPAHQPLLEWVTPSHVEETHRRVSPARLFDERNEANRRTGDLQHAWFASIEWLDEGEPADEQLRRTARSFRIDDAELTRQIQMFRAALRKPAIRDLLSKGRHPGAIRVDRERPFAVRDGVNFVRGRIDRLVWFSNQSGEISADLIDFKTDDVPAAAIPARMQHYRSQLEIYRRAAAKLLRVPIDRVAAKIVFTVDGAVRRLD